MAFNAANKVPDVYIDEIQLPGPITGVGTSTAAFIGPAIAGEPRKPKLITSWTQFLDNFGPDVSRLDPNDPLRNDPNRAYIPSPPVFVTHAVRGFFDNGGSACYFVRASSAAQSSLPLKDIPGTADALIVQAKKEGLGGDKITVLVKKASILPPTNPVTLNGGIKSAKNDKAELDAAVAFLPGDFVLIEEAGNSDVARVASVTGVNLTFERSLSREYTNAATIRTADFAPAQDSFRLPTVAGVEAGTYLRIAQAGGVPVEETVVVKSVTPLNKRVVFSSPLTKTFRVGTADAITAESLEFSLTITPETGPAEKYEKLAMDPRHSRYFKKVLDSANPPSIVSVTKGNSTQPPAQNLPTEVDPAKNLQGGKDENIGAISDADFKNALATLEAIDDVNILAIPDNVSQAVQGALIEHCEKMQDRFAILDPAAGDLARSDIENQRNNLGSDRGFAAIYYPRIHISNPFGGDPLVVPPSGHIAGVFARTDDSKGVHKAPANEQLRGALNLDAKLTLTEMGRLNEQSINVLRAIPRGGIKVWGARTIATNTQWRYVNIRRLLLFIEESIQEGTQFCVFEPNDLALRKKVVRIVTDFLTRAWRDGALFGATPDQAFRVRADEELNPPDLRALGQLVIEVIVVPTTPAEFIVFRIISDPTGNVLIEQP